MVQKILGKIFGLTVGGSGIIAVLVVAGILLKILNIHQTAGNLSIWAGIAIGIALGVLGIFGVLITLIKRIIY
ncbi:hypothetical protein HY498_01505 [Candidatus Woesearchaeota archaeon]|nr:hypothetical protein [Candidatus Woesearchaeota archaeon]